MGGSGSGGSNHNGRPAIESCPCLSIKALKKQGALDEGAAGTFQWTGNTINFFMRWADMLVLTWVKGGGEQVEQFLGLQWLIHRRSFGGYQYYFVCPGCRGRCMKVHFYLGRFKCRVCHRLRYRSQRRSEYWRLRAALEKIAKELGGNYEWGDVKAPERPIGYRQKAYLQKAAKFEMLADRLDELSFCQLIKYSRLI